MEAIKTRGKGKNGLLTVQIPKQFEGQELEVIVLSSPENVSDNKPDNAKNEEKINRLMKVIGTAKDKNTTFDKHDVYDQ